MHTRARREKGPGADARSRQCERNGCRNQGAAAARTGGTVGGGGGIRYALRGHHESFVQWAGVVPPLIATPACRTSCSDRMSHERPLSAPAW
ncbi:hypothetical protein CU044_1871 [Streptomyces sp. L-9-10]|nr:hypothetical protein CU044_1871 [Streptomyces sp. L-9-10]